MLANSLSLVDDNMPAHQRLLKTHLCHWYCHAYY